MLPQALQDLQTDQLPTNSSLTSSILAQRCRAGYARRLLVTVIEAKGLRMRKGLTMAFSSNEMPSPLVEVTVPGFETLATPVKHRTLRCVVCVDVGTNKITTYIHDCTMLHASCLQADVGHGRRDV